MRSELDDPHATLRRLNSVGDYREAIRLQIGLDADPDFTTETTSDIAHREVQFAVAMQHAGFFSLAYDAYQSALELAGDGGSLDARLRARVQIQIAVLDERLGRFDRAWATLANIKRPEAPEEVGIALMTDADWYFLTYMKLCLQREDYSLARLHLAKHKPNTIHSNDWGIVLEELLRARKRRYFSTKALSKIDEITTRYRTYDAPGEPWIGLLVGPHLARSNPAAAAAMMESAAVNAERMGKFFLVAALYEQLSRCYARIPGMMGFAQTAFSRSLNAFGRCHLIMQRQIRARLARLAGELGLNVADTGNLALRSSSLLFDRSHIRFSTMCVEHGERVGVPPHRAFELFVEDWAPLRLPGKVQPLDPGEPAADVLLIREHQGRRYGIAVQAKHYARPRQSVPKKNPRLRDLGEKYDATIDRFVFVVSTSSPFGWSDAMWHSQTSQSLRNTITDRDVAIQVVTEPELQTDVVLNDHLLRTFFPSVARA